MQDQLLEDINQMVESLKSELYEKMPQWAETQNPSEFFDFEQELQVTLNALQSRIVGAVLESIHRDAAFVAECKRQALHDLGMQTNGLREKLVRTLSGYQVQIKTPYMVLSATEDQKEGDNHRRQGTGIYPVLRRLGIVRGSTPRFLAEINHQMADGPSGAEVEERLASREVMFAQTPMWHQVRDFACIALWQRQVAASNLDTVEVIEPAPLAGKRVVVGVDGGRLRIRVNKEASYKDTAKSYTAEDCEPKLFVIYTIDEKGNKDSKGEFVYDGTLQPNEMLFLLLKLRLKQLGVEKAEVLIIVGDGATWIWRGAEDLRLCFGLDKSHVFEIVDFAHSVGKLTIPARLGIKDRWQQQTWLRRMRKLLKEGKIDAVIEALEGLDRSKDEDGDIPKAIKYFQNHQPRMQYALFRREGLPIGSGVIESGVRRIVNFRLRGASLYWTPEKAEEILYLRCQIKGGRWNVFFKSVLTKWANDMSVSLTKVYQIKEQIRYRFLKSHPPVHVDKSHSGVIRWARGVINSTNALILDTETTGLSDDDEIIQVAILDLQGNVVLKLSFKPTKQISQGAFAVHGIDEIDLAHSPSFSECYDTISNIVRNKNIIAYNAAFDQRLLSQTCRKYDLPNLENITWHCAMEKYACFWGEHRGKNGFKRYNLATACKQEDITMGEVHDAVRDCLLTFELVKAMAIADDEE
jgi:DNA polymerase III epsilon subunit-like protein